MKWIMLAMATMVVACDPPKMTNADMLSVCKSICGKRPIASFEIRYDDGYDCRCADKPQCEPECDGGR